jgi:hypothetical protein
LMCMLSFMCYLFKVKCLHVVVLHRGTQASNGQALSGIYHRD